MQTEHAVGHLRIHLRNPLTYSALVRQPFHKASWQPQKATVLWNSRPNTALEQNRVAVDLWFFPATDGFVTISTRWFSRNSAIASWNRKTSGHMGRLLVMGWKLFRTIKTSSCHLPLSKSLNKPLFSVRKTRINTRLQQSSMSFCRIPPTSQNPQGAGAEIDDSQVSNSESSFLGCCAEFQWH